MAEKPADGPATGSRGLTHAEIRDLAERFPVPERASRVLAAAGLPLGAQPLWRVDNAYEFWFEVSTLLANGALHNGRAGLLAAATSAGLDDLFDTAPERWERASPASLLRPSWGAVGFYGRTEELARLERWCDEDDETPLRLIVGPGGQGKTRLALRLCVRRRAEGWAAGMLSASAGVDVLDAAGGWVRPLLVVVDYAETREAQLCMLLERLIRHRSSGRRRVLLLARSASDDAQWWASLRGRYPDVCAAVVPDPLSPLDTASDDRDHSYRRALMDLAHARRAVRHDVDWPGLAATLAPPDDLHEPSYELALALHTRALTDLLQAGPEPVPGLGPGRELADVLLDHERQYWAGSAAARGLAPLSYPLSLLGRAVAAAALCGAGDEQQAVATLGRLPLLEKETRSARLALAEWLRDLYPTPSGAYWGTLAPDRVAEHHIGVTLRDHSGLAEALLAGASDRQLVHGLVILARATVHQPHLPARLAELLTTHPTIAAAVEQLDVADLTAVIDALPQRSVELAHAGAALTAHALARLRADADGGNSGTHIRLLGVLSDRLTYLGRRDEALALSQEAATGLQLLAMAQPDVYLPILARALDNLSIQLDYAGRDQEALAPIEEAVALNRRLVEAQPDTVRPDLAHSLTNLARQMARAGRQDEALAAAEEAVTLYRQLVQARPAAFRADLATALNNLSQRLGDIGRVNDALTAVEEAVTIRRSVAQVRRDAYLPDLAFSLITTSLALARLQRRDEALSAIREAITLYRELIQARPDTFIPNLATSLSHLRDQLADLGLREESLAAGAEAVALLRGLAQGSPYLFSSLLITSLNDHTRQLADLGLWEESLAAAEEAVSIARPLAEAQPGTHCGLADSLNSLAFSLRHFRRREEALAVSEEAVALYRQLAHLQPDIYQNNLATALRNLSIHLSDLGRHEQAVVFVEEAVGICRLLSQTRPDKCGHNLAGSLNNLSNRLATLGRRQEALAAVQESVDIYRQLPRNQDDELRADLAMALGNLSIRLFDLGLPEDALSAIEESTNIYHQLTETRPTAFLSHLAGALDKAGVYLSDLGRHQEALAAARNAVSIYQGLYLPLPDTFAGLLSMAFLNLGVIERSAGDRTEALFALISAALYGQGHNMPTILSIVTPMLREERERNQQAFDTVWNKLIAMTLQDANPPHDANPGRDADGPREDPSATIPASNPKPPV
ncbi:tetratricopeptide repeat protein [Frankia gtarii]|uniref:tetratricopeptide repeat protein n=1 Tax=Frankia gtarii TaxID=2950102 RepID=UPI0021C1225E|nr:tetratricopeptide repeat protein [Frankia gtarii]